MLSTSRRQPEHHPWRRATLAWFLIIACSSAAFANGAPGTASGVGGSLCQPWLALRPCAVAARGEGLSTGLAAGRKLPRRGGKVHQENRQLVRSGSGRTGSRAPWGKNGWKAESAPNSPLPGHQQLESEMSGLFHRALKVGESRQAAWEVLHPRGARSRLPTARNASKDTQSQGGLLQARQKLLTHGAQPLWGNANRSVPQPERTRQTTLIPVKPPGTLHPGISLKGCPTQRFPSILPRCPVDEMGHTGPQPWTLSGHEGCGR